MALFIRLLGASDKGADLSRAVAAVRAGGTVDNVIYEVDPEELRDVPGTPFAYWVGERIRRLFKELPPFEGDGRTVRVGLQTSDDFRFVRAWWEVPAERILDASNGPDWREDLAAFQAWCRRRTHEGKRWAPFAKGGEYSPFYADIHLVVNWERDGKEIRNFVDPRTGRTYSRPQNTDYYFRPGLTWPERTTSGYCQQAMPAGIIPSTKGQGVYANDVRVLAPLLSAHCTRAFQYLEELMIGLGEESVSGSAARDYTGGSVSRLPYPHDLLCQKRTALDVAARCIAESRRKEQTSNDVSWAFAALGRTAESIVGLVKAEQSERLSEWDENLDLSANVERLVRAHLGFSPAEVSELASVVGPHPALDLPERPAEEIRDAVSAALARSVDALIDEAVESGLASRSITKKSFFVSRFHELLAQRLGCSAKSVLQAHQLVGELPAGDLEKHVRETLSFVVGVAFGRWDVRLALDASLAAKIPDPFDPLSVCPPGMLAGPDGLPARADAIASDEWLRARPDASRLPPPGSVEHPAITAAEYPLEIPWDGVLVDDPGLAGDGPARADIVQRMQAVLACIYDDRAGAIEAEFCELLGVRELRDYLRRPNGFFADHLSRYSKSRRRAPIYWPLSTESGSYTIWLYYPRLTADTLYRAVTEHLEPKLTRVEDRLARAEAEQRSAAGREAARLAREAGALASLRDELRELRAELLRVAELPYRPSLDDGVQITAAPLWRLFRHRPWRKVLQETWTKLEEGEYDWAHLAHAIWPDRVRERCRRDRSIAIAHGLEELYEGEPERPRRRRRRGG